MNEQSTARETALIVEDDQDFVESIRIHIDHMGYNLDSAADGETGLSMALANQYAFILLDNDLPRLEGSEVCKRIREQNAEVPIIVISTHSEEVSKVLLLEFGADDYVTKPFSAPELKARLRAVLRRASGSNSGGLRLLKFGDIELNLDRHTVSKQGKRVEITGYEFAILELLSSTPGKVFSREDIVRAVYGEDLVNYDSSVNTHISHLRNKLETNPKKPQLIITVRGAGYRLGGDDE